MLYGQDSTARPTTTTCFPHPISPASSVGFNLITHTAASRLSGPISCPLFPENWGYWILSLQMPMCFATWTRDSPPIFTYGSSFGSVFGISPVPPPVFRQN